MEFAPTPGVVFDIAVPGNIEVQQGDVYYTIEITIEAKQWKVMKRYAEFQELYSELVKFYGKQVPRLTGNVPPWKKAEPETVAKRSRKFQAWLNTIRRDFARWEPVGENVVKVRLAPDKHIFINTFLYKFLGMVKLTEKARPNLPTKETVPLPVKGYRKENYLQHVPAHELVGVEITGYEIRADDVYYVFAVSLGEHKWEVAKRYADWVELDRVLHSHFAVERVPYLTGKAVPWKKHDPETLTKRRRKLEGYLRQARDGLTSAHVKPSQSAEGIMTEVRLAGRVGELPTALFDFLNMRVLYERQVDEPPPPPEPLDHQQQQQQQQQQQPQPPNQRPTPPPVKPAPSVAPAVTKPAPLDVAEPFLQNGKRVFDLDAPKEIGGVRRNLAPRAVPGPPLTSSKLDSILRSIREFNDDELMIDLVEHEAWPQGQEGQGAFGLTCQQLAAIVEVLFFNDTRTQLIKIMLPLVTNPTPPHDDALWDLLDFYDDIDFLQEIIDRLPPFVA